MRRLLLHNPGPEVTVEFEGVPYGIPHGDTEVAGHFAADPPPPRPREAEGVPEGITPFQYIVATYAVRRIPGAILDLVNEPDPEEEEIPTDELVEEEEPGPQPRRKGILRRRR